MRVIASNDNATAIDYGFAVLFRYANGREVWSKTAKTDKEFFDEMMGDKRAIPSDDEQEDEEHAQLTLF